MKNGRKWRVFVGLQFRMKRQTSSNKVRRFNRTMKILVKKKEKKEKADIGIHGATYIPVKQLNK